jgi:K+/H+ antiporter YhaU regulatory subunit KhtT
VLAIARGDHASGLATPSPTEPLRAGDVLALAGSDEAIAKARVLLTSTTSIPGQASSTNNT